MRHGNVAQGSFEDPDPAMLVGEALDVPLTFQRVQAIKCGLVGGNLAGDLNLSNKGRFPVFGKVPLYKVEHDLLL